MTLGNELFHPSEEQKKSLPKISVIIPVKNEESTLGHCLESLRESSLYYETEIIVVDGGSADNTVLLAKNLADKVIESPKQGRGFQMHLGAMQARGDLLLFLHADTIPPRNWQTVLEKYFFNAKADFVGGSFHLGFDRSDFPYDVIAGLANFRTHVTGVPHGDQTLFVRKDAYVRSGGFPDVELMEEYHFIPRLRQFGKFRVLSEKVVSSSRRYSARGPIRNALKNSLIVFLFYLGVPAERLARLYR